MSSDYPETGRRPSRGMRPSQTYAFNGILSPEVVKGLSAYSPVERIDALGENGFIIVKSGSASWDNIEDEIVRLIMEHCVPVPGCSLVIATRSSSRYRLISYEPPVQAQHLSVQ